MIGREHVFVLRDHAARNCATGSGQVFGVAVDDIVGAFGRVLTLERFVQERGAHGRVQHDSHAVLMCQLADGGNVQNIAVRVAR